MFRPTTARSNSVVRANGYQYKRQWQQSRQSSNAPRRTTNNTEASTRTTSLAKTAAQAGPSGGLLALGAAALLGLSLFGWGKKDDDDKKKGSKDMDPNFTSDRGSDSNKGSRANSPLSDNKKPDVVFFVGGSGKEKAELISKASAEFNYVTINTEQLIQSEMASGSSNGNLIKKALQNNEPIPVDIVIGLIKKAMSANQGKKYLIEDFPRNTNDARNWDAAMSDLVNLRMVFLINNAHTGTTQDKKLGDVDKPYMTGLKTFSSMEQLTPIEQHYGQRGIATRINTIDSGAPAAVKLREVFTYIDKEQRGDQMQNSHVKTITPSGVKQH